MNPTVQAQANSSQQPPFPAAGRNVSSNLQPHRVRHDCRACGRPGMRRYLELGPTPLANSFLYSEIEFADERSYPLDVYFCEHCSLSQLADVIAPEILFRHYIYTTGTSDTIAQHNREYARTVTGMMKLTPADLVVEVASNDGSLLKCFQAEGARVLGIEPALNIAEMARAQGIDTIPEFFNLPTAQRVQKDRGSAKVLIGNNVLAHVDEPVDFLRGMKALMTADGVAVLEFPYAGEYVDRMEYDTVYHEHLSYFTVTSLMHLFARAGLSLIRIDRVPVHGGSLRVYAQHAESANGHAESVKAMSDDETRRGMTTFERYERLAADVRKNREALLKLLEDLRAQGKTVAAYGAPAKGNTLLNYCGIDTRLVLYTVDKNPLKVGTYTPGAHIPVLKVEMLLESQPDYVLILAWNFADEIIRQQSEYVRRGGKFIIPIPEPKIL
jgi:hypothetical protein